MQGYLNKAGYKAHKTELTLAINKFFHIQAPNNKCMLIPIPKTTSISVQTPQSWWEKYEYIYVRHMKGYTNSYEGKDVV